MGRGARFVPCDPSAKGPMAAVGAVGVSKGQG